MKTITAIACLFLLTGCIESSIDDNKVNTYKIIEADGFIMRLNTITGETHRIIIQRDIGGELWDTFWDEIEVPTLNEKISSSERLKQHNADYKERRDGKQ